MTMRVRLPDITWGKKFPKITIDLEKCTVPFACKKCLQICPTGVFSVARVMEREERLKEMDPRIPGNYVLHVARRHKCISCNLCIEVCPVDAIKIEAPAEERLRPDVKGVQWEST